VVIRLPVAGAGCCILYYYPLVHSWIALRLGCIGRMGRLDDGMNHGCIYCIEIPEVLGRSSHIWEHALIHFVFSLAYVQVALQSYS
jgi:hypothetical protein